MSCQILLPDYCKAFTLHLSFRKGKDFILKAFISLDIFFFFICLFKLEDNLKGHIVQLPAINRDTYN